LKLKIIEKGEYIEKIDGIPARKRLATVALYTVVDF
jgi:hypothetical protein